MKNCNIELFMPASAGEYDNVRNLVEQGCIAKVHYWCLPQTELSSMPEGVDVIHTTSLSDSALFMNMASQATADYLLYVAKHSVEMPSAETIMKMVDAMQNDNSVMLYSDCYKVVDGEREEAPVIDYQCGSLRNDFDFGSLILIRTSALKEYLAQEKIMYKFAGFYQMRLALSRTGSFTHFKEFAYTECEDDNRKSGEKQFDYVNPAQREVQVEMEFACTEHLKRLGGYLCPGKYEKIDLSEGEFPVEASVIIPVLNRKTTIADAINSVLRQSCSFTFNILVVDNHSTDGTSEIIDSFDDGRVVHIVPESTSLGIGGCWNHAVQSKMCGRFAVQLDSDDIYSGDDTLQKIVDEFYRQQCAMLIGTYRICNFELETLPPGIIDHREWTEENGRNNALRINGLGAPRAFYTPVIRSIGFPNVSYGEDYAVGLKISRRYRIGRIYDVLYLCRRWGGNSDAALSRDKVNANNYYKDSIRSEELRERIKLVKEWAGPCRRGISFFFDKQLAAWSDVAERYKALDAVETKSFGNGIEMQFNPARIRSTAAAVDKKSIAERPCFLCPDNRPSEQIGRDICGSLEILVNPFPIIGEHYTIVAKEHTPQQIAPFYPDMLFIARRWRGMAIFYNGATCGASAPDHAHLQAVPSRHLPMLTSKWMKRILGDATLVCGCKEDGILFSASYIVPLFLIKSSTEQSMEESFAKLMSALPIDDAATEPAVNIITFHKASEGWTTIVVPRAKHRPDCYFAEGSGQRIISPGTIDMAGMIIAARREDFDNITADDAASIMKEVALPLDVCAEVVAKLNGAE